LFFLKKKLFFSWCNKL